ncbi:MAG: AAA family ATPase [Acidobacteria bacterium]|nr:AAA family ATPase [Acidobacteriota bacterium]
MSIPVIAFCNNKGGVGKTSLVYHIAWMCSELGVPALAADLDPQANLTAAFLPEDRLEELWPASGLAQTVFGSVQPLIRGVGDISDPHIEHIQDNLGLLPGDLSLATFEDQLSTAWGECVDGQERGFRAVSAFWRIMQRGADAISASVVLLDLGPSLGAINRCALVSSDFVVVPLAPDLFSQRGLMNLGPTIKSWRQQWRDRMIRKPALGPELPSGSIVPLGYIVQQHAVRLGRVVKAYDRWISQIPGVYGSFVLDTPSQPGLFASEDENCLGFVKHFHSLMPLAQEARKPVFLLRAADGALGAHQSAVTTAYHDFRLLTNTILSRAGIPTASK